MTTRADRERSGRTRGDRTVDGLKAGAGRLVVLSLPYNVAGAQSFDLLRIQTQANLDALKQQIESEINRVGRFFGEDGYPGIDSDQFFSKARLGTKT